MSMSMPMQSRSPAVSAPPPKKQRSDEAGHENVQSHSSVLREMDRVSAIGSTASGTGANSTGARSSMPPADHIDDALTRRRKQLQELRRQQQKSDLLSVARSQLSGSAPPVSNANSNSSGVSTRVPVQGGGGRGPPLRSSLKLNQNTTLNGPAAVPVPVPVSAPPLAASLPPPTHFTPMPPPSIPQKVDESSITITEMPPTASVPPTTVPPRAAEPVTATAPSPASPEIVRRLNFAASAPRMDAKQTSALVPEPQSSHQEDALTATVAATAVPRRRDTSPSAASTTTSSSPRTSRPVRPPPITPSLGDTSATTKAITLLSQQPAATTNGTIEPGPPASRQAFLSSMYDAADSPATAAKRNSELKLIRELKQVHQEKEDAFRQVVRLREQIQKLQKHHDFESIKERTAQELQHLVEIADRNGDRAALKWAREQASGTKSASKGLFSKTPLSGPGRAASPSRRAMTGAIGPGVRKRVSTPHPKRVNDDTSNGEESKLLAKATETNPDEFDSEVATYHVRRPYVRIDNDEFWNEVGELSNEEYQVSADVGKPASLEIAAKIKVDGSVLLLSGLCTVRHKKPRSTKWKIFEDVDDMDKPLGSVMFIDEEANEGEYWLDEIYEEAMSTRDTYCSSLLATASALKSTIQANPLPSPPNGMLVKVEGSASHESPMQPVSPMHPTSLAPHSSPMELEPPVQNSSQSMRPPVVEENFAGAPTSQLPVREANSSQPMQPRSNNPEPIKVERDNVPVLPVETKSEAKPKKVVPPAPSPVEEDAASDILSNLLGFVFLCIFQVCYFLLIKLPIRILVLTTLASVAGAILSILWLFLANDNGAEELGANFGYGFNRPGIQ